MSISHDSVNRFLYREAYTPLDLFEEVRGSLNFTINWACCLHWRVTAWFMSKKACGHTSDNWTEGLLVRLKDRLRHYVICLSNDEPPGSFGRTDFSNVHDQHRMIEQYHRAIKQVCHLEHFQVSGDVQLQRLRAMEIISNCYRLQRDLFNEVIASFIAGFMPKLRNT